MTPKKRSVDEFTYDGTRRVSLLTAIRELVTFRECIWSFAARSFRVRYKQTVLGMAWAVLQPLAFLGIFVAFFGGLVHKGSGASYAASVLAALIAWTFVSNGVAFGGDSLIADGDLVRKVYFPREAPVLGAIISYIPDFAIGFVIFMIAAPLTDAHLGWSLALVPLLFVALMIPTVAIALPLAALSVYYRDFKYALPFAIQLWLFASPVAYPVTQISSDWRWLYALANPVVGVLDSFRRTMAVGVAPSWDLLGISLASGTLMLLVGYRVFKQLEREFADVI